MSLIACLTAALLAATDAFEVRNAAGEAVTGEIVALAEDRLTLATDAGRVDVPADQVVSAMRAGKASRRESPTAWITLVDGSTVLATGYRVAGDRAEIDCLASAAAKAPIESVASVRFKEQTAAIAAQWAAVLEADHAGDLIVIRKNDSIDFLEGVVGGISDAQVEFTHEGELFPVNREKVEGVVYATKRQANGGFCTLVDAGGSRFSVANAEMLDGRVRIRTPAGVEVERPLADVAAVEFKVRYLSDLPPESVRFVPYLGKTANLPASLVEFYRPRFNRGFEGPVLSLDGRDYAKGIAIRSRTEIVYRLHDEYRWLRAVAGIDDAVRPQGNVHLAIYGDDRPLVERTVTGRETAQPLELDLRGVARLRIVVDYGADLDVGDYFDLCDARLIP